MRKIYINHFDKDTLLMFTYLQVFVKLLNDNLNDRNQHYNEIKNRDDKFAFLIPEVKKIDESIVNIVDGVLEQAHFFLKKEELDAISDGAIAVANLVEELGHDPQKIKSFLKERGFKTEYEELKK